MATVSFRIAESILKRALNYEFNDTDQDSYSITLLNNGSTILDLESETCDFASAAYDSTTKKAYVQLTAPVYFAVDSGTTINGLSLTALDGSTVTVFITNQAIEERTYTANGTYTVSDLIIRIGE